MMFSALYCILLFCLTLEKTSTLQECRSDRGGILAKRKRVSETEHE